MGKLVKRNLRDHLVDSIGSQIVRGQLQPGIALPSEDVLLARYDVSRTVLREAFNVLSGKRLLEARPKRGTVVRPRSDWNRLDPEVLRWIGEDGGAGGQAAARHRLDYLMEVRRIIEPTAAGLAAQRATPDNLARMTAAYDQMAEAGSDVEAFMEADLAFHIACLHATKNEFLFPVAHAIRSAMMQSLQVTNREPEENRAVSLPLHWAILDAVRAHDSEAAAMAMDRHLNDTEYRRARAEQRGKSAGPFVLPLQLAKGK